MALAHIALPQLRFRGGAGTAHPRPPLLLSISAVIVAAAVCLPVAYLAVRTLGAGDTVGDILFRARTLAIIVRTGLLVAIVTSGAVLLAVPIAWLTTRTDLPMRGFWAVAAALPLVIPSYVAGMLAVVALGPRGMLQHGLEKLFGVQRLPDIYGLPGAVLVLVLLSYPYVYITVRSSLRRLDPSMEEASRSLGHSGLHTLRRVTIPLLRPAIAAGAILVALYTLSDFGAVSLLGYETFTWAIYLQYETTFDRTIASALSMVLVVFAVGLLILDSQTQAKGRFHRTAAGAARVPGLVRLGRWRWVALSFIGTIFLLAVAAPIAILLFWIARGAALNGISFPVGAAWNSVRVSAVAAGVTTAAAFPVALLAVRFRGRLAAVVDRTSHLGFALPGIVVALSLVFFGIRFASPVYQSSALLVFAYGVLFLPAASGSIKASLMQVSPRVEEAARTLGRSQWRVVLEVTLPLVVPGLLAGAAMVFLLTMKELPATLILSPLGFHTLATQVWSAASEAFFAKAAVPAIMLVVVSGIPTAFLLLRDSRRQSNGHGPRVREPGRLEE
ncbi:MAG: iron ABC transporter permease [Chloroflexi bacterium]|nr:iron ABC transporter permease [Chloroflexota bacterium]